MDKKRIKELEQDIVRQRFADIMRDMNNGTITQEAEKKYQEQLDYQAELEDFQEWLSGLNLWQKLIYLFFDKLYYFPRRSSLVLIVLLAVFGLAVYISSFFLLTSCLAFVFMEDTSTVSMTACFCYYFQVLLVILFPFLKLHVKTILPVLLWCAIELVLSVIYLAMTGFIGGVISGVVVGLIGIFVLTIPDSILKHLCKG